MESSMTHPPLPDGDLGIPDAVARHYRAFSDRDFDAAVEPLIPAAVLTEVDETTGATRVIASSRDQIADYMRQSFLHALYAAAPLVSTTDEGTPLVDVAWTSVDPTDGVLRRGRSRIAFTLVDGLIAEIQIRSTVERG
jgi:hypothetical protein